MGVGGMIGGGIFSVLGLSISEAGHAAPIAFAIGGAIALLTGLCHARLGLEFRSSGGSFTYLERAFGNPNIAAIGGWMLLIGYVGTLSLYAYTFGTYGSALLGGSGDDGSTMHHLLQTLVILSFLGINLYGVKASGSSELIIVTVKVLILALFAIIGLMHIQPDKLQPLFNHGWNGVLMGAALIFVAYEGFELIPNAINDMEDPERNLTRGIILSILITISVYVLVSLVAVGNLSAEEVKRYGEYALAVAAKPFLGQAGFVLIGIAALFSTSSAINATLFGTARLGMIMATERVLPRAFGFRRQTNNIPWVSLVVISAATIAFINIANLEIISSFASATFLLVFALINLSGWRLRRRIGLAAWIPLTGLVMSLSSLAALIGFLYQTEPRHLLWIGGIYGALILIELMIPRKMPDEHDTRD